MPTPFTHLRISQDLLGDAALPAHYRELLRRQRPAFQLGSIVADARVASGDGREVTHFYAYGQPMVERPWRAMLRLHPQLQSACDEAHLAFLAGYVAHLAADEAWALKMVRPHFWGAEWDGVEGRDKFFALHLILTVWDERDERALEGWQALSLRRSQPQNWLPFMPDAILCLWRDLVAGQLDPSGSSLTLEIFGQRLQMDPALVRGALDDPAAMQRRLWRFVPQPLFDEVTRLCYVYARDQLAAYLTEYMPALASA